MLSLENPRGFRRQSPVVINGQDSTLHSLIETLYTTHYGRQAQKIGLKIADRVELENRLQPHPGMVSLTRQERSVLALVTLGKSNKEVAAELNIDFSTVKAHVRNIMIKTGASNRIQLALGVQKQRQNDSRRKA